MCRPNYQSWGVGADEDRKKINQEERKETKNKCGEKRAK